MNPKIQNWIVRKPVARGRGGVVASQNMHAARAGATIAERFGDETARVDLGGQHVLHEDAADGKSPAMFLATADGDERQSTEVFDAIAVRRELCTKIDPKLSSAEHARIDAELVTPAAHSSQVHDL